MTASVAPAELKRSNSSKKDLSKWNVSKEAFIANRGDHKPWKDSTDYEKAEQVVLILLRIVLLIFIVFGFVCTLALLSDSFKLIGGKGLGNTIKKSSFLQNPISATIIGMLISLVLQSSSTLISLLVGMVAGNLITVHQAIPIMIGSEMGSSLMNVLISMGQSGDRDQFRRAFAAASINDAFNLMNYLTVLPLEISFNVLENLSALIVQPLSHVHTKKFKTIQLLTEPILKKIVRIDSEALTRVSTIMASDNQTAIQMVDRKTFIYRCINLDTRERLSFCPYEHFFANSLLPDQTIGFILLAASIGLLILCLFGIVKVMMSLLGGPMALMINKIVRYSFPPPFKWLTGYLLMLIGAIVVVIMESSSVFRSALTPLVGIGAIPLERYYCFVVGSNLGTTSTGVLAALASDPSQLQETLQIALCQTLYNLFGLVFFYPIPFMRKIPLTIAMKVGDTVAKYRWFSLIYTVTIFFLMPAFLLVLSLLPSTIMLSICAFLVIFFVIIVLINWFQVSFPRFLPKSLRTWNLLPDWMHSLKPYDKWMQRVCSAIPYCPRRFFAPPSEEESKSTRKEPDLLYKQLSQQTPV